MILSPMPTGNGAWVLHKQLEKMIAGYRVVDYSPWWTLFPPALRRFSAGSLPQVIHTTLDYACWVRRADVPLVATAHNFVLDRFMNRYSSPLRRLHYATDLRWSVARSLAQADRVTVVSHWLADQLREQMDYHQPIEVIPNGVDTERFSPREQPRVPGPTRVLFCGNLSLRKRADLIAPLAAALGADFELMYTGGLNAHKVVRGGKNLRPLGVVAPEKMPQVYRDADLLFMPSVREGFGLCVAEAMATGLPILAYRGSAIPELVIDGAGGILSDDGSLESYVEAIRLLAASPQRCAEMGQFNRARVISAFSNTNMVEGYRKVFADL